MIPSNPSEEPVTAHAPVRICDVGGWTDTWFGSPGQVCSLAAGPGVTVRAEAAPREPGIPPAHLVAPDIGVDHRFGPDDGDGWQVAPPGTRSLLECAVAEALSKVDPPASWSATVTITSAVPPGASLGTSASVVVAVLAAVLGLWDEAPTTAGELARLAHGVETSRAGRESGVQDQWAAALGGAVHLAIDTYPDVRVLPLELQPRVVEALGDRLVTVALGAHDSSAVHGDVAKAFLSCDGAEHDRVRRAGRDLAALAGQAAAALSDGDIDRWADVLVRSTRAQARLHPDLIGVDHRRAIAVAEAMGAIGWKVNGAGGDGGSLTVVSPEGGAADLRRAFAEADARWQVLDLEPCAGGVTVVRRQGPPPPSAG